MRRTVIDIGTNTILMLIADFNPQSNEIITIIDLQRIPRLGRGVDKNKNILHESVEKAITILNEYKNISYENGSEKITATGTSFLRDSSNNDLFVTTVKERTGIEIEILTGEEEAKWTFIGGILDNLKRKNGVLEVTTIDIGGGSTEITTGIPPSTLSVNSLENVRIAAKSFDVGSVRIKEKFFSAQPPSIVEMGKAVEYILSHLSKFENFEQFEKSLLIGLAGTVTTLGAIKLGLDRFIAEKVDNLQLSIQDINGLINFFCSRSLEELLEMGNYMEGRADIILSGTLILKCFMEKFGFDRLTISTKGLRYGIFLRESCQ